MKTKEDFIKIQLNIDRLTPLQFDGILRAMEEYAEQQVRNHAPDTKELYQPVNGYHPVAYLHLDDIKGLGYDGSELDENDLRSLAINLGEKLNYDYGEFLRELCRDELKLKKL